MVRTTSSTVLSESDESRNGRILKANTAMKILAASKNMYRVKFPDGRKGYIKSNQIEMIIEPISRRTADVKSKLKDNPNKDSYLVEVIDVGENFEILGEYNSYWLVKNGNDKAGWMKMVSLN